MKIPKGNKINVFPDGAPADLPNAVNVTQLTYDVATQLESGEIERLIYNLQWVLVGRKEMPMPRPLFADGGPC